MIADTTAPVGPFERLFARANPRALDRMEQILITLLFAWMVYRVLGSANIYAPLLLISEAAVVIFTLIRRPTSEISLRLGDWLLALTATAAPLLIHPGPDSFHAIAPLGVGLILFGNACQGLAKLSLRRSFGIAPANRGIEAGGLYRYVRHPMYAGYLAVHIGVLILMPSVFNFAIYAIGWCAQILRLQAEEALLTRDPAYVAFKERVRYRLIPGLI